MYKQQYLETESICEINFTLMECTIVTRLDHLSITTQSSFNNVYKQNISRSQKSISTSAMNEIVKFAEILAAHQLKK